MKSFIKRFIRDENGATALEYGLLAGLISVMVIGGATIAGTSLDTLFSGIGTELQGAAANIGAADAPADTTTP